MYSLPFTVCHQKSPLVSLAVTISLKVAIIYESLIGKEKKQNDFSYFACLSANI